MSKSLLLAALVGLISTAAGAQIVVTPSAPNGWGIDPIRGAPTGTGAQSITNAAPRSGLGSLMMSVSNNGADRTGMGIMQSYGSLSALTSLSFDWMASAPATQSPTLRMYLDVANPLGGRTTGQMAWYVDNSINGSVPTNTWTTSNLLDFDGNNKFFLRFFGSTAGPSGQLATTCVNTSRGSDFNARMQDIASWEAACTGSGGTVSLADAKVIGLSLDMGAWPGSGSYTETNYMDNVTIGFDGSAPIRYNFEPDAAVVATPEPASLVLIGTGLLGLAGFVRRRRA